MPTMNIDARSAQLRSVVGAIAVAAGMSLLGSRAIAQSVGEVEFARGVGFAQTEGQGPRTLGKGLSLRQGDRVTTAEGASAIVKMQDGTRMTVRPNSELVIQQYKFSESAPDNSMVMQLFRGGFRAITGLITKNSPDAARVVTRTATLGIRGTDFDARICTNECKTESAKIPEKANANAVQASAKLVSALGEINAVDSFGVRRRVVPGGSVYPGDVVETGSSASAVIAFRDDSRLTLGPVTRFRVDSFVFDANNPKDGRFLVSLLRGSLRALTGLIGKSNTRNVGFATPTATVGIRGTGLDIDCATDAGCSLFTWLGSIEVTPNGQSALQVLQTGQGLFVSPNAIRPLNGPTLQNLPRPDGVVVDTKQLFSADAVDDGQEGLFVFVRDGHIEVVTGRQTLHLGRGETGFAGIDGNTARPLLTPLFLEFDRTPMPNSKHPMLSTVLGENRVRATNQCR
ncbi:FecR domain-containing protein [Rhodoferax sp. AJA081-3]|nr:FecR domain-containing protein [Rhodoferax sp. AJA081-3]